MYLISASSQAVVGNPDVEQLIKYSLVPTCAEAHILLWLAGKQAMNSRDQGSVQGDYLYAKTDFMDVNGSCALEDQF